jgi:SNF2 family DNA or RNA helicase
MLWLTSALLIPMATDETVIGKVFEHLRRVPLTLLVCDEAHRMKNPKTQTNKNLSALHCQRRLLLTGSPLQNNLGELYALVNFCKPGDKTPLSDSRGRSRWCT